MNKIVIFSLIYIAGVLISAFAQILLKKVANSANEEKRSLLKEYLNVKTLIAYFLFFSATICTLFAFKEVPLSMGAILGTTEYIFVAILSYLFLHEKISKRTLIGLLIIITGVLIYSL